jgi:hypothetical protein
MAARAGMMPEAESHFRAAFAVDAADTYLLGAYADFLLDSDRSAEVLPLLRDKTGTDPLLLRYALALQAQHSKELPVQIEKLRDRFAASRLRDSRGKIGRCKRSRRMSASYWNPRSRPTMPRRSMQSGIG